MKDLNIYITETKASSTVNKLKAEIAKNWAEDKVCIVNHKFKFYMSYYIYVYDIPSKEDLRKLDNIIKTYIPKYPGADDKKLDLKFNAIKDQVKKHTDAEGALKYLYDIPVTYLGFTNKDIE